MILIRICKGVIVHSMKLLIIPFLLLFLSCEEEDINSFIRACDGPSDIVIHNDSQFYCGDLFVLSEIANMQYADDRYILDVGNQYWESTRLVEFQLNCGYSHQLKRLPDNIGDLTALEELRINCRLHSLPPSIGNLSNLQDLDLFNNDLTSLPIEICNLPNTCYIDVEYNDLCPEYNFDCIDDFGIQYPFSCP